MADSTDNNGNPALAKVHEDAMKAANASWTETDKLYVSVCSALVALTALFGHSAGGPGVSVSWVGVLVLLLSVNWAILIKRYRRKILFALDGLAQESGDSAIARYYQTERERFKRDWKDYLIVGIVALASAILICHPG